MNTDCRQLSSWMGCVNHMPKLQAQRKLQSSVIIIVHLCFIPPQFDLRRRCVTINLKQQFVVKEAKDAVIKVYDYYKPGMNIWLATITSKLKMPDIQDAYIIPANCPYFDPPPKKKKKKKKKMRNEQFYHVSLFFTKICL